MAGVKGWYWAIGWNQPGMVSAGMKALEMSGSRIRGMAMLPAASGFGLARPMPTAIQVSARANSTMSPNAASHSRAFASVERNPMATPTAPTRTTLITDCSTLPTTCPISTEGRWIAIVRKRAMRPSVISMETYTAAPITVLPMVISSKPGTM
ncbi:hypothetical protein GCM10011583_56170 [Streptomyces camponoticapitis]|uniref:Uncharacterized protein n=1 Tax=Streptomyces camponoticapitis TaxID=1616125 RepID=A0ABQ2EM75_9ACTN|nr:hypothetical protein GCM10011583_56170 [Streptomyces camponoticapitis]